MSTTRLAAGSLPVHIPDVLETLAQLPNDEVFTPPKLAGAMLDILPSEVWTRPDFRWLDPATKSGVFLREAAKRLMIGLAEWEPNPANRRQHILRKMLYGAAITQMSGDIARRSVYQTRDATGAGLKDESMRGLLVPFGDPDGNISYVPTEHTLDRNGRHCVICHAPAALVRERREHYAYSFIHNAYPVKEMTGVRFDVIVGNPPYQIGAEGTTRTMPIYQHFVRKAIGLKPKYVLMITPSRWFTGGLGLDEYRDEMIKDRRLVKLVDNPKLFDVFPQVEIKGGVSYFLWDRDHDDDCEFSTRIDGRIISTAIRDLREGHGVVIRDNKASALVHKILEQSGGSVESWFWPRLAFSQEWRTNYRGENEQPFEGSVPLIHNSGVGYVHPESFERNFDLVSKWKVLLPKAGDGHGREVSYVIGEPLAVAPGSACTESYFVTGAFDTKDECENYAFYLSTKFARFLVLQRKATQDITSERFRFVPSLPMTQRWTDADLYSYFDLAPDEIQYIESSLHPREPVLSLNSAIPASHLPGGHKYRASGSANGLDDDEAEGE
ncbi:Eco57I restriction-modification methylase domain-containing protein [Micromonospora sp. C97]|uniref:Eco57I restriction-modification methylase domain-containing protein n=1 Tax=Micromonospora sp. C97 TaxID=2824883 RepID=UPI001B35D124|nr:Eco57I restriction-modification methylase domain-containing protein [Micromonospora sp. C97]MBQ1029185.1 Eco57I restriction-modification methylase domain-containing protein [Micromonospora sp. C97]